MNTHQHTPGPWKVETPENNSLYWRIRGSQIGTRFKIANVLYAAETPHERNQAEANARLIAAAPELLRDLIELVDTVDGNYAELTEICRATIAKATGQQ